MISHNRTNFDKQLNVLETSLLQLASMVEKAVVGCLQALKNSDHAQAQQVISADRQLNALRYEVETDALSVLALQQPVLSRDLRYIAAVMNIAGELERMGDYAKGIARISDKLQGTAPIHIITNLDKMAVLSNEMLHTAMSAFIERDVVEAERVIGMDDAMDDLYNIVYRDLLDVMLADNSLVDLSTMLLWAAHNLERLGDRVTNICERIRFVVTGVMEDSPGLHRTN